MHPRAARLIAALGLAPHPEGGYYRELHRSRLLVRPEDGRSVRAGLTVIYFLLARDDLSRWHRVGSDEAWHFYEGAPLELLESDPDFARIDRHLLGPFADDARPVHVIPPGAWQAARSTGDYTLVGCTVGPGFDFADFAMLRDDPAAAKLLELREPALTRFV